MFAFLVSRIVQYAFTFWIAITLNFLLPRLMPGNPLALIAGEDVGLLTTEQRARIAAEYGLDQSLPNQYVRYLGNLARGDLGKSFRNKKPIRIILEERLPWTLLLTGCGLLISTGIGVALGAWAGWRRGSKRDVGMLASAAFVESLPSFWLAMMFIALFSVNWRIFPAFGAFTFASSAQGLDHAADVLKHLALPLMTLVIVSIPQPFLVTRFAIIGLRREQFVVAARAKGLSQHKVATRHVLRNAALPIVTTFTLSLAFAIGGATVIETVFAYPGVGRLIYESVLGRDYPVLQATFLLLTLAVLLANLATDMVYPLLDPRVRARTDVPTR